MKLPRSFRVEAVVLRHSDWGEADRLLTLFTRQHGKLRAIAKGARRIRSRKAGHLEPFMHVTLQLARGHDLFIVTQADTLQAFLPIHDNLGKTSQAAYTIELLDRFTYEDETENIIFQLLTKTLLTSKRRRAWLAIRWYEISAGLLGFTAPLSAPVATVVKQKTSSFALQGGVICPTCGKGLPGVWQVSMEALKYLRHFQRSDYATARKAQPTAELRLEVETLMQRYITYLLERELNTPAFIKQITR
jgi:DNA repair protein RecO (recombination protein O)